MIYHLVFIMVNELSGVQFGLKSFAWFQNWMSMQREFHLKSQAWFQTKIAWHKVQLPLYYIHFEIAQIQDIASSNISLMQYWAGLKLNSSLFWGEKNNSFGNKGSKICHMILFISHFPVIWLVTLNKPWNLISCCVFTEPSSLAGEKRCNLTQKMVWFVDNRLEPIRLQGPPVISKWV